MAAPTATPAARTSGRRAYPFGLGLAVLIAALATVAARWVPLVGAPVLGIAAGVVLSPWAGRGSVLRPGLGFASGRVLQVAVVLLGTQMSLRQVWRVGSTSLPVMLGTLAACLVLAYALGRRLGIASDLRTLVGVGTAICGASAIAAVSPVLRAKSNDVAYAVTTIFVFNVAAVLAFPPLGHLLGLSQHAFGLFAGTAVNDTSSVVAAATTYGQQAGNYAVVVKLTRTLMIIPITVSLALLGARRPVADGAVADGAVATRVRLTRLVPWFLIGFLLMAAADSLGWFPAGTHTPLQKLAVFLITVALSAIGLSTDLRGLRRTGARPLALGFVLWLTVATTSLLLQAVIG